MKKFFLFLILVQSSLAKPVPAGLFTDHAVLQRNQPIPVWGTADPLEQIVVSFGGRDYPAAADAKGNWHVIIPPQSASNQPLSLVIRGKNDTLTINDILVGEVWIASGQSNMQMTLADCENAPSEVASANLPEIRQFEVPRTGSLEPLKSVTGQWVPCSPATAGKFTGVGFFFARNLHAKLGIPIGLINSSFGGTPAEAWTSREALLGTPEFRPAAEAAIDNMKKAPADQAAFPAQLAEWENKNSVADSTNQGFPKGWAAPDFDDSSWKTISSPFNLKSALGIKHGGVFWLRKHVDFAKEAAGVAFDLHLGYLPEQYDTVYFNGQQVGSIGKEPPNFYTSPRSYHIPGHLVKAGRNVIAVRFVAHTENGALYIAGSKISLPVADPKTLDDQWKLAFEKEFPTVSAEALAKRPIPNRSSLQLTPTALFNAMIFPLIPFPIRGVIWYQGENNAFPAQMAESYRRLLALLISDWRNRWSAAGGVREPFPFYLVQLANNDAPLYDHNESTWAVLRESQTWVSEKVPNTGMAVIIDLGSAITIHPKNKQDVGNRLALLALAKTYGEKNLVYQAPIYKSHTISNGKVHVHFDTGGSHLMIASKVGLAPVQSTPGAKLEWFEIAGEDGKFVWANAVIEGDSVVVSSPEVRKPIQVRYAWATNPAGCNLYNQAGLPASPFRTPTRPQPFEKHFH